MVIIYAISVIAVFIGWILIKKSEKTLNIITSTAISLIILLGYNVVINYILNLVTIPINLITLASANILVFIIELVLIITKKEIQKYELKIIDIIFCTIITIICLIISYIQYDSLSDFNIKYLTTDPTIHYGWALEFKNSDKLLRDDETAYVTIPGAYINTGIAMKMFNFDEIDSYKVFVAYDIFIFILTGISMYVILRELNLKKGKYLNYIAFIFSILYLLGYPLISMLFGFSYLTLALPIINVIIYLFETYSKEEIKIEYLIFVITLLNFFTFFTYYLFIPFLYGAEFIYINIINYKKEKKIFTKRNMLIIFITLIVPTILSMHYFNFILQLKNGGEDIVNATSAYGYIYENKYTDFILLIPLSVITIVQERKNIKYYTVILVLTLLYIILMYLANIFNFVSMYYIMKNYFVLWGITHIMTYKAIIYLHESDKYIGIIAILSYILALIVLKDFSVLYRSNYTILDQAIYEAKVTFTKDEVEFLKNIKDMTKEKEDIELYGTQKQRMWSSQFLKYTEPEEERRILDEEIQENKDKYKYLIVLKRNSSDEDVENKIILYEDEQGYIIQNY